MLNNDIEIRCLCSNEPMVKHLENDKLAIFFCKNCGVHIIISHPKETKTVKTKPTTKESKKKPKKKYSTHPKEIKLTPLQEQYLRQHTSKDFLQRFPLCNYTKYQITQKRWNLLHTKGTISKGEPNEAAN